MKDTWIDDPSTVREHVAALVADHVPVWADGDGIGVWGRLVRDEDGTLGFRPGRGAVGAVPEQVILEVTDLFSTQLLVCAVQEWTPGLPWKLGEPSMVHTCAMTFHPSKGVTRTARLPLAPIVPERRRIAA